MMFPAVMIRKSTVRYAFTVLLTVCIFYFVAFSRLQNFGAHTLKRLIGYSALLVDTPGCKIPNFDPFHPNVRKHIKITKSYTCPGMPVFLTPEPNGSVLLNETELKKHYKVSSKSISCHYNPILWKNVSDGQSEVYFLEGEQKRLRFGVTLPDEFLKVKCLIRYEWLTQFIPLAPFKQKTRKIEAPTKSTNLNVILFAIDSVSKLNFFRQFEKTRAFLKKISPFELHGYTKVGDNTFPNMVPFLSGHFVEDMWNISEVQNVYFDELDLVWKKYAEIGYLTYYAEDSPFSGTFNYLKKGFRVPPTDYYFRPMGLAMEASNTRHRSYCFNSQLDVDIIYGYLKNFILTMGEQPFFAFNFVSTMSHDYLNSAGYADDPTFSLLQDLQEMGTLDKSMLIFFSDHGIRFGEIRQTYIGKFEERMPFIYIHFPPSFLEKYPHAAANVRINQERLTTPFDIHATLLHLLEILKSDSTEVSEKAFLTQHGISLFNEIPETRTCDDASILPHWCVCQTLQPVSATNAVALQSAMAVVDAINRQLEPYRNLCEHLTLDEIKDVIMRQGNNQMLSFVRNERNETGMYVVYGNKVKSLTDYMVTLKVKPSEGVFEGTVTRDDETGTYEVLGISRINAYGTQSKCIEDHFVQKFCFCITS